MSVEDRIQVLKFCSSVFNAIFLILGFSIFGCSVWILFDDGNFISILSAEEVKVVAGGLFVIGLVVVGVSLLGCVGAQLETRFLLIMYMVFLICIVLGQLFVTLVLLINKGKISNTLTLTLETVIKEYGANNTELSRTDKLLDNIQLYERCCGWKNASDWRNNSFILTVSPSLANETVLPCSCFNSSSSSSSCFPLPGDSTGPFGTGGNHYAQGCKVKIRAWLEENTLTILGMDLSLLLVQVLQFTLTVCMYQSVGQKARMKKQSQLIKSEPQGPDLAY
ncbi:CD82 antigen [Aplochiton taeniatus]